MMLPCPTTRRRARSLMLAAVCWLAAPALPATALGAEQGAEPSKEEADRGVKLFAKAQRLYDAAKYEDALQLFLDVDALLSSPNALLYVARCLRELGRLPEAFEAMSDAAGLAGERAKSDKRYLETRDAAAAEREALAGKVGRLVIAVDAPPEGLEIELGTRRLHRDAIGRELGVEPGTITVKASAPGHDPLVRELELVAGKLETVALIMTRTATGPDTPTVPPVAESREPGVALFASGWALLGVGAVGIVMFAVAGSMANARFSDIEDTCDAAPCTDPTLADEIEGGKKLDLIANVGAGIGAVGLAAGTVLLIIGWPDGDTEGGARRTSLAVGGGPDGARVLSTVRF